MRKWAVQDAKARFSELLDTCVEEGPQLVTRRGEDKAVLVPIEKWLELTRTDKPTLKDILLSFAGPRFDLELPERGPMDLREIEDLS